MTIERQVADVLRAFSDLDALMTAECREISEANAPAGGEPIWTEKHCQILARSLRTGLDGIITGEERTRLLGLFDPHFVAGIAGTDGRLAWGRRAEALRVLSGRGAQQALDELSYMGDPAAFQIFRSRLHDPDPEIRIAAITGLRNIDNPRTIPLLVACLADPDVEVRRASIDSLGHKGRTSQTPLPAEVIRALIDRASDDTDTWARARAIWALGDANDRNPDVEIVIQNALVDPDATLRRAGLIALANFRPTRDSDFGTLINALQDRNGSVRQTAIERLEAGFIREPSRRAEYMDRLQRILAATGPDRETDQFVRGAAERVLARLRESILTP